MRKALFCLFLSLFTFWVQSQTPLKLNLGKSTMPIGAYYYPEHWDESQWERDLKRMFELGFEFTHMAEFAWARIEPEEGKYDFSWLDKNVELAAKYGLKVIMCTPTPCPPAWLTQKHPEILLEDASGYTVKHGMRLNANGANPVYQAYIRKVVIEMARRYGRNPAVCGWQIDNEPHFEGFYDYSDFAQVDFRRWLKNKYTTINQLNAAWGASFWSLTYNNFEQIVCPSAKEYASSPHAFLDFKRYTADALASALRFQSTLLRDNVSPKQWITTNFAYYRFLPTVDLFRSRNDLDFASHTMYLLSTYLDAPKGDLGYRLGSGMELSFSGEMARSQKGFTGIMELQPGQINWGQWNAQPLPGAVRMWIWHSFGLGEKFICTYRFRQPLFGSEQFHKGIMEPDGTTVSPGGQEYVQAIKEINALKINSKSGQIPTEVSGRATAFLWKQDNLMSMETTKVTNSWDTWRHYYSYYQKLKSMACLVTFIAEIDSFDVRKYPFMVAPAYEMVDEKVIQKWKKYVSDGGHLVLSVRTGMKDNNSHLWQTMLQQPIWNLIGAKIDGFDQLPPSETGNINFGTDKFQWNVWGDFISPDRNTETWATYADQYYAGKPCVIKRNLGKGSVVYVGVESKDIAMEEAVLRKLYTTSGAQILDLPDYVFVEWRDGYWVAVNYSSQKFELNIADEKQIVLGDKTLVPGGVTVWKN
ncbi:MAG: beta-galactosidase [Bacteroidales bacterium]